MDAEKARKQLFEYLDVSLRLSHEKLHTSKKTDSSRLAWGRLMNQFIMSYAKLLETEELEQRVAKLEEIIKNGVVIPGEKRK